MATLRTHQGSSASIRAPVGEAGACPLEGGQAADPPQVSQIAAWKHTRTATRE